MLALTILCTNILWIAALGSHAGSTPPASIFAEAKQPPPPPATIPTPIGPPPPPPTTTPVATATPTSTPVDTATAEAATAVAGATTTATAAPTPTATKGPAANALSFTLDAARVAKVNNPGDLSGLAAIKPGSTVWLMMYYSVHHLPKTMQRTTTYEVLYNNKTVFRVVFDTTAKPSDVGRFSRYTSYKAPANLPFGHYTFRASLAFGTKTRHVSWKFSVARQEKVATKKSS